MKTIRVLLALLAVAPAAGATAVHAADQMSVEAELALIAARFAEPAIMPSGDGKAWWLEIHGEVQGKPGSLLLAWDGQGRHFVKASVPALAQFSAAFGRRESWLFLPTKGKLFMVKHEPLEVLTVLAECRVWPIVKSQIAAVADATAIYPLPENLKLAPADTGEVTTAFGKLTVRVSRDENGLPTVRLKAGEFSGWMSCRAWERRPVAEFETLFAPPPAAKVQRVDVADLRWMLAAAARLFSEHVLRRLNPQIVPDPIPDLPREGGQVVVQLASSPVQTCAPPKPAKPGLARRIARKAQLMWERMMKDQ